MVDERTHRLGSARLLSLCAILLGLFLMHGSPAAAVDGCHGRAGSTHALHDSHDSHASATASAESAPTQPGTLRATDDMAAHGTLCVATPAEQRIPLPVAPLTALFALAALAAWAVHRAWRPGGTGRRGPPGGRGLLLQVCIART
ncbi:hypothetical protein [Streptomyces diastatochromogenes]|uniref:Uncharacterized protein n=1 Tax=Streptomyces diastatochromogenes TaxID=42236 RepID=A0A233S7Q0_STRDA|nr:hypothetical protein [Streptomyces diastatochromogenes]OXY91695.1 hypothetical protein BEK98_28695 [Streptomyces diastatochromogenes]